MKTLIRIVAISLVMAVTGPAAYSFEGAVGSLYKAIYGTEGLSATRRLAFNRNWSPEVYTTTSAHSEVAPVTTTTVTTTTETEPVYIDSRYGTLTPQERAENRRKMQMQKKRAIHPNVELDSDRANDVPAQ